MNEILSQAEIDKLMKDLISGDDDGKPTGPPQAVKYYDFKTANRFTKEHIRAVNVVFKNFGHLLSNHFMGMLRANCEAEVLSIEEMSFNEFSNSVPSPVIIAAVSTTPFEGPFVFEISKEISYSIINRVFGGIKEVRSEDRQFTEIELAIMERMLRQMLKIMDESWSKMMDSSSCLDKIETSMQFAQIVDMNEPVLMVTMNVVIENESGLIGVCLPHQSMEPFMKRITPKLMYSWNKNNKVLAQPEKIKESIIDTKVVISSEFNATEATVRDIISLREGDVIQLHHRVDEPVVVKFQQVPKYSGSIGQYKNNLAVKLTQPFLGDEIHG